MESKILRVVAITIGSFYGQLFYASAQTQLAAWTFDSTPAAPNTPTSFNANLGAQSGSAILYANGSNGSSTWTTTTTGNELTTFAGTTTNDPRTITFAGSALTIENSSANGKTIVIKFSMTNFKDPIVSFATRGTSTGFNIHQWAWSTDGTVFTNVGTNTAITGSTFTTQSVDLSSINFVDKASTVYLRLTVTGATTASGNNRLDNIVIHASVALPPGFTPSYPKAQTVTSTGFQSVVNLDKPCIAYVVVLPDGATPPTSVHVKAGQDGSGNSLAAYLKTTLSVSAPGTDFTRQVDELTPGTDYDVYFVAENADGIQTLPVKVDITTLNAADTSPPNFSASYPSINGIGPAFFSVRTALTETGKTYFVVLNAGDRTPDAAQVKQGKDASGTPLLANLIGTIPVASPNTEFNLTVNGLMPATAYDVYLVSEDNIPNLQPIPIKIAVSTAIVFTENFNDCNGNVSSFTQVSVTGIQFWDCNGYGNNTTNGVQINAGTSSGSTANEDWLISPLLTLTTNATVSFDNKKDYPGADISFKISTDYNGRSTPGSASWADLMFTKSTNTGATGTWVTSGPIDLSLYNNQNVYVAFVYTSGSTANSGARWTVDNFSVVYATAHYIGMSTAALGGFGYVQSPNTSVAKSFSVQAVGLSADLTITAPANFEVSKDGAGFGSSISFTPAESTTPLTIYVHFNPAAGVGVVNGSITLVSGVFSRNVTVSGTEGTDPRNNSFDVVTYNLEFFGTDIKDAGGNEFGPRDDALQINNVKTVMQTMAADVIAVQEVSDDNAFNQLVAGLPGYDKIISNRWSYSFDPPDPNFPPQKIGFIYNTATVQLVSTRVMFVQLYSDIKAGTVTLPSYPGGLSSSFWSSGRLPFMATFDVTINGISKRIRMIDIHAKSGSAQSDYDRRKYDVQVLYDSLTAQYATDNIILLGDFNDDVDASLLNGEASSYKAIVDDATNFKVLTYALSQTGASSFPKSNSFIDHIVISTELNNSYIDHSTAVENARTYVTNYINTTSDHLPVIARFQLVRMDQAIIFGALPDKTVGDAPFSLSATTSSLLTVSYSSPADKIILRDNQVTIVKAGRVSITASQTGNTNFNSATPVDQSFCIKPAKPTVTVSNANTATPTLTSSAAGGNQWYLNDTAFSSATGTTLTVTSAGVYKVQAKTDDCASEFSTDTPINITGDLHSILDNVTVYPNPVENYLEVRGLKGEVTFSQVFDMTGRMSSLVLERRDENHRAHVENLSPGVFFLRIQEAATVHQIRFIKK